MILHGVETGEGPALVLLHGLFGQARNFGTVQRRLATQFRVIALDLRNHGASPHGGGMAYADMAADVAESLAARGAGAALVVGHSMGGKVAMRLALDFPLAVARLVVVDIAPVTYASAFEGYAAAMAAMELHPGLTRAAADAALAPAVADPAVRQFLLQNLAFGDPPRWRIGLAGIAAGLPDIESWPAVTARYAGPTLFVAGERSATFAPSIAASSWTSSRAPGSSRSGIRGIGCMPTIRRASSRCWTRFSSVRPETRPLDQGGATGYHQVSFWRHPGTTRVGAPKQERT